MDNSQIASLFEETVDPVEDGEDLQNLPGIGEGHAEKIRVIEGIEFLSRSAGRMGLKAAHDQVEDLGRQLDKLDSIKRWVMAGSFRRREVLNTVSADTLRQRL